MVLWLCGPRCKELEELRGASRGYSKSQFRASQLVMFRLQEPDSRVWRPASRLQQAAVAWSRQWVSWRSVRPTAPAGTLTGIALTQRRTGPEHARISCAGLAGWKLVNLNICLAIDMYNCHDDAPRSGECNSERCNQWASIATIMGRLLPHALKRHGSKFVPMTTRRWRTCSCRCCLRAAVRTR